MSSPFIKHVSSPTLAIIGKSKGCGITVYPAQGLDPG